jgi:hypothetical protein
MTIKEKENLILEKTFLIGDVLNGLSIEDALWILNSCIYGAIQQLQDPEKKLPKRKAVEH